MSVTREQIAAFADGELTGDDAGAVAAAIAADPALQAEVEAHRALRARLSAHFAPIAAEPVPERLRAAVAAGGSGEVIDFAAAAARRRATPASRRWYAVPAIAASLVVGLVGFNAWRAQGYADGALAAALDHQLSASAPTGAPVRMLLSFRDGTGAFCRAYAAQQGSGIACRDGRGWRLRPLGGATAEQSAEYRQAASGEAEVMAAAQAMAAGPALDAAAEAAAARRGWQR